MWSIPKSPADRWRAVIVICEWCILVLWVGAILMEVLIPPDSGVFDHQAEKAYLADRASSCDTANASPDRDRLTNSIGREKVYDGTHRDSE